MNYWTEHSSPHNHYYSDQEAERDLPFFEEHFEDFDAENWPEFSADMTLGEFYDRIAEAREQLEAEGVDAEFLQFIPALLSAAPSIIKGVSAAAPIIAKGVSAVAPVIARGVSAVAPNIVRGVSAVAQSFARPGVPAYNPPPRPAAPYQAPQPRPHTPPPVAPRPLPSFRPPVRRPLRPVQPPATSSVVPPPVVPSPPAAPTPQTPSTSGNDSMLNTMLSILANQNLQSALQSATANTSIPIGNTEIPVSAAIDIIGQVAGLLTGNQEPEPTEAYPDFIFDSFGNALVDPDSLEDTANLLLQRIR